MAEIKITNPYLMEHYHEDYQVQYRIDISDVIDFYTYHDAPETVEIYMTQIELDKLIRQLIEKSDMGKEGNFG